MSTETITDKDHKKAERHDDHGARQTAPKEQAQGHGQQHPQLRAPQRGIAVWGPLLGVMVLAAFIIFGVWKHVERNREEEAFAKENSETVVGVKTVHRDQKVIDLTLPGSVQANQATTLYARTNGYLAKWLVDIGDSVTAGQTLAVIETPDVEAQLRQAEGTLNQAKANFEIARVTAVRWQELYARKVVSAQDNDQQQSSYQNAAAAQSAAQANVNLLEQQLSFNQIVAPFAGTITNRFLDVGALVSSGGGSGGTAIYGLAQTDPLRIYVYVPQSNSALIHEGVTAKLNVREFPGRPFTATVTRTAGAIDPQSRTLLTELQVPNKDGTLYAGIYGEIEFSLTQGGSAPVIVPANAFMFRPQGAQVVVIKDYKVKWTTIQVGRDYGSELEVLGGIEDGDRVVVNPSDDLIDGMEVKVQEAQSVAGAGAAPSGGAAAVTSGSGGAK